MTDEEKEIKEWVNERRKGSDLMSKLLLRNKQLEKENAELNRDKTELEKQLKYNPYVILLQNEKAEMAEDFCKQIERLEEDKGQIIFESDLKIKALEEMIEKMKCCGNCKHEQDSNTDYYCEDCKRFANETDIEKWELAE